MNVKTAKSLSTSSLLSTFPNQPIHFYLNICSSIDQLKQIHSQTISNGLLSSHPSPALNKLLHAFSLLINPHVESSLAYVQSIFNQIPCPTSFSYNVVIRACTLLSSPSSAFRLFAIMRQRGVSPDFHTYPFVLKASTKLLDRNLATALHSQVVKFGFCCDKFVHNTLIYAYSDVGLMVEATNLFGESNMKDAVTSNALMTGFIKAGDIGSAREVFEELPTKDNVSWSTLLSGYAHLNQCREVFELFQKMIITSSSNPDGASLVSILSACARLGTLEHGKAVHGYIQRREILLSSHLSTGLVDMYSKCGSITLALSVFELSPYKQLFTWNAVIMGLAKHGHGEKSFEYFLKMLDSGVRPDGITFLGVLVGCSHAGLVDEAKRWFDKMEAVYGVLPELKHYGCMVDLLSRVGQIEEAMKLIERMPMEGDIYVWGGLLGGCRKHDNVEVAEIASRRVMELNPEDGGTYSVMINMYTKEKRWKDAADIRKLMYERGITKNAGCSSIEVDGVSHEFVAGERWHPQCDEIYMVLDGHHNRHHH